MKTNKYIVIPPLQVFSTIYRKKKKKRERVYTLSKDRIMYAVGEAESQGPLTQ